MAAGKYRAEDTGLFLFRTREGGFGWIFVGVEVRDDTLPFGTPARGAVATRPRFWSISTARVSARSALTVLNALRVESTDSILSSAARHASTADNAPDRTASRVSETDVMSVIR